MTFFFTKTTIYKQLYGHFFLKFNLCQLTFSAVVSSLVIKVILS